MTYISREVRHLVLSHVVRNIKPPPMLLVRGWNFECLGILYIYGVSFVLHTTRFLTEEAIKF